MTSQLASFAVNLARLCVWLALLMLIFIPLERIFALHRQKVFRKAFGADVAYYFISSLVPKVLLILPLSGLAWAVHRWMPSAFYTWSAAWPFALRFAASMIVGEVGAYWGHRWSHEIPLLWRFHAIHHSPEEVDWLVSTRAHPFDMFFTRICAFVPMYLLGLAQPMGDQLDVVPYLVIIVSTVWGFFIHSNINWRFGWLEWLISTPAFHHWHHTNDGAEFVNKNYAPMLPWVDALFGTLYLPKRQWPLKYGIDDVIARGIADQLAEPIERMLG
jgi:sterol desaturase/sphingolipid hydroxylase (fatty acid hydroxylase superfamily)